LRFLFVLFVCLFFSDLSLQSQTDSNYFILPPFKVYQKEKGKEARYEFENERNLMIVKDSFLIADPKKYLYKVNVNDIRGIAFFSKTHGSSLIPILGGIGFGLGFLIGSVGVSTGGSTDFNAGHALLGGAILGGMFALIGAGISIITGGFDETEFKDRDFTYKKNTIIDNFKKYRLKK
jgi:hypothetical protein